nr:MAG TPA: hypothetical protein [Caudoviricetes sp.]
MTTPPLRMFSEAGALFVWGHSTDARIERISSVIV